jgi:hypothetical protein
MHFGLNLLWLNLLFVTILFDRVKVQVSLISLTSAKLPINCNDIRHRRTHS